MREAFDAFDNDGDGYLELTELEGLLGLLDPDHPEEDDALAHHMIDGDQDGDGKIDFQEMKLAMKDAGKEMTDDELTALIAQVDENCDGWCASSSPYPSSPPPPLAHSLEFSI